MESLSTIRARAVDGDVLDVDVVAAKTVAGDGDQLVGQGLALAQGELRAGDGDLGVFVVAAPRGIDADSALQGAAVQAAGQVEGDGGGTITADVGRGDAGDIVRVVRTSSPATMIFSSDTFWLAISSQSKLPLG